MKNSPKNPSPNSAVRERGPEKQKKLTQAIEKGKKGDYAGAARILEELISEYDAPADAYLLLGRAYHALKDYSRALAAFEDYLKHRPRSAQGYLFAGRTYLTLNMPHRAVPFLRKAQERNPQDPIIMAFLGIAYLKSRHSQLAVDMLQVAVETAPENKRIYRAYLNALLIRGIRLCRLEDYQYGIQMLRFVLENGLDLPLLRLELGRACQETGNPEEALEHYSQALRFAPGDNRIRWRKTSLLMLLGRNAEALAEIELIRSGDRGLPNLPWNSKLADFYLIRSLLETGEWRRAADACRDWLKKRPPDGMIRLMYAEALRNLRNYTAAANHLERALEQESGQIELWYAVILVAWESKDWKSLRRALKRAGALGGDGNLIKRFSILYEVRTGGDERKNIALLQDAIRTLGPEPELMYALAERYLNVGLIEEALSWFRKTRELKAGHESSYLGEIAALETLAAEGIPQAGEKLRAAYNEYLSRWPDNFSVRRERALYLIRVFEYAEAAGELEKLLVWEPSNPSLRRILAYAYRKSGRYREAAVFLKSLLKEKPKNVELLLEYSGCLERAGATPQAVAVLEKAMGVLKNSSDLPLALGILYYRTQKTEKAFDLLREAAARNTRDKRPYQWMALIARKTGNKGEAKKYEKEAEERARNS